MSSLCFSFSLLFILFLSSSSAHSNHDDRKSLLEFKSLIANNPHNAMANWSPANPLCNWTGITCTRRHQMDRVIGLHLTGMDMQGPISPFIGNLSFLRSLDLSYNALQGVIPPQLGRLFRLRKLWLQFNHLEGSIPSHIAGCHNLVDLELSFNILSGSIPLELGSLPHLQKLFLKANSFTGTIPSSLGNLSVLNILHIGNNSLTGDIPLEICFLASLQELYLFKNELSGRIPQEIGLLVHLQVFYLHENELSSSIPTSLSNISSLTRIDISRNNLSGNIPHELGFLTNLQWLNLEENELSGTIPTSLSNISSLATLSIASNKLTGHIPLDFGDKFNNLSYLSLWGNQLSGNIPISIGNCSKLTVLTLSNNNLSGTVPVELGKLSLLERLNLWSNQLESGSATTLPFLTALTNCSRLRDIELTDNKLSGILPSTIGKLSRNLSYLSFSMNTIEGNIPLQISNLSSLTLLDLSTNLFNGSIPSLQSFVKLERLTLADNSLEGNIPNHFKPLKHLGLLTLSANMLSGKIPSSLRHLKQLRVLALHHNYLSNKIPVSLGECTNLEMLDLAHNRLSGSIPHEISKLSNIHFFLNLSWNSLEGSLPAEISKIVMAQDIDISGNQLTGIIPAALGNCIALESLNLSRNLFQGSIPDTLGSLRNLRVLDLSSNSLSGTIPIAIKTLKMLQYLNLSFNKLTGEIYEREFSANQTISLIGNSGLCGPEVFSLHACSTPRSHFKVLKKVVFPIVGAMGFILFCLLLTFLWRGKLQIQNFAFPQTIFQKVERRRISYQELFKATNGFLEANLLGKGSFGSVYKGILSDGTLVAVKVLNLQNDQVEKSFEVECKVLQKVRHRNLVRVITSCSNLHFKGLVFEFMCNGSLDKHLYPERDDNDGEKLCEFGLKTRLDIAIDVAHAIEYLHHDSPVQVVHCDIKPSNVLLDEDMSGHVADFGIARLVGVTSTESLTSTIALKGSAGYIAPEYGFGEMISIKGDVYSYGILLLEMLTKKMPTSDMFVGDLNLHKWVNFAFPGRVVEVIDDGLFSEVDGDAFEENDEYKCILSLLRVGLLCSKDSSEERPTMRDVAIVLEGIRQDLVGNKRLGRSISNFLGNTSAATTHDQSSTF